VSLTSIAIAFGMVAVVFVAIGAASVRWVSGGRGPGAGGSSPPTAPLAWGAAIRIAWLPAAAEALLLTLLATLWFGSLGSGGWVWVFLLLGALAGGGDRWLRQRLAGGPAWRDIRLFAAGLLKYLLAGGLCAWCLT
jgi:hypothetical protein